MSRVLALDHGAARCGAAVSDPSRTIALPLDPIERPDSKRGLSEVVAICRDQGVDTVVVGLPVSLSGGESEQSLSARGFADRLRARLGGVEVEMFDERLTTHEARSRPGGAGLDSKAAAVLLERWLEVHPTGSR